MTKAINKKTLRGKIIIIILLVLAFVVYRLVYKKSKLKEKPAVEQAVAEVVVEKEPAKLEEPEKPQEVVGCKSDEAAINGVEVAAALQNGEAATWLDKNGLSKVACLTFDDGPSARTSEVLETLEGHGVRGTFFVLGKQLESEFGQDALKKTYEGGNAIGNHTYTHDYAHLYPGRKLNLENFKAEAEQTDAKLKEVLGAGFVTRIVRAPGGFCSWKGMDALHDHLATIGKAAIDWTAESGDAVSGPPKTAEQIVEYTKASVGDQRLVVLLMHDAPAKKETVKALPTIISYLKEKGYEFKVLV
ncbi:MAG: polysaccharide deacetylase [Oscillospiraceae bacterium]|nr:polysaccharide deacetylase [Oscillospiraceae bacterium]